METPEEEDVAACLDRDAGGFWVGVVGTGHGSGPALRLATANTLRHQNGLEQHEKYGRG